MITSRTHRQRGLIALVEVLGLSAWFSATAVAPGLRAEWGMGSTATVWLTASVQIGFAAGAITSGLLTLADRVAPHRLLTVGALGAATSTAALALVATGPWVAIPLRFLTGVFLAGVYPVGMKLVASWSPSRERGRTFGVMLGALTLGSALPHLLGDAGLLPWRTVMLTAAGTTATAAVITLLLIRPGPHLDHRTVTASPRRAVALVTARRPRLVTLGYFGHMWELYALWTWLATFVVAGREERRDAVTSTGTIAFVAIGVAGAVGCLLGGWASDRVGRRPAAVTALLVSGACCLASPLVFTAPAAVLVGFLVVWGGAVIADSGVFSTLLSETIDPRLVGTALTLQTATGFLLTVLPIHLVPAAADLIGWRYAFLVLAPGPLLGAVATAALRASATRPLQPKDHHDHRPFAHNTIHRSDRATLTEGRAG